MRFDRDTKEALLFVMGSLGIVSQAALVATNHGISLPLLTIYSAMCGLPAMFGLDDLRRSYKDRNTDDTEDDDQHSKEGAP